MARKHGKRLQDLYANIDRKKRYPVGEAVNLLKESSKVGFDETVEVAMNLGVDPRKADQIVRGMVRLPHGTGKPVRVAVFAKGDKVTEAQEAGADLTDSDELVSMIQAGNLAFDRVIATPDMMATIGKFGKVLGPRGLMPNPKLGTVTQNIADAVKEAKAGSVEFRTDRGGVIHDGVGKVSFSEQAIQENVRAFVDAINKAKPSGAKGTYIKSISVSTTMGPGLGLDVADAVAA